MTDAQRQADILAELLETVRGVTNYLDHHPDRPPHQNDFGRIVIAISEARRLLNETEAGEPEWLFVMYVLFVSIHDNCRRYMAAVEAMNANPRPTCH
jgi:hypothetical protein